VDLNEQECYLVLLVRYDSMRMSVRNPRVGVDLVSGYRVADYIALHIQRNNQ